MCNGHVWGTWTVSFFHKKFLRVVPYHVLLQTLARGQHACICTLPEAILGVSVITVLYISVHMLIYEKWTDGDDCPSQQ